jgi:hypothetical protein
MYTIKQINYNYYHQLTDKLNQLYKEGLKVVNILNIEPSGYVDHMHRATILMIKIKEE